MLVRTLCGAVAARVGRVENDVDQVILIIERIRVAHHLTKALPVMCELSKCMQYMNLALGDLVLNHRRNKACHSSIIEQLTIIIQPKRYG